MSFIELAIHPKSIMLNYPIYFLEFISKIKIALMPLPEHKKKKRTNMYFPKSLAYYHREYFPVYFRIYYM